MPEGIGASGRPAPEMIRLYHALSAEGFDTIDDQDGAVKILHVVPITPLERHLLVDHSRDDFIDHLVREEIDLFADRSDPPGARKSDPNAELP